MAGLTTKDIDVYESTKPLRHRRFIPCRVVGIEDRYWAGDINPNGGAIAWVIHWVVRVAKLTAQLLHELQRRKGKPRHRFHVYRRWEWELPLL